MNDGKINFLEKVKSIVEFTGRFVILSRLSSNRIYKNDINVM